MSRIVERAEIEQLGIIEPQAELWTAIVPIAGKGTRLGFSHPKVLYPILGRPMLYWLWDLLRPTCAKIIFVVSPSGKSEIELEAMKLNSPEKIDFVVQPEPIGMGDAILCAQHAVESKFVLIIWGDQISLSNQTVCDCQIIHESRSNSALTFPSVIKENPYINIIRDDKSRILQVEEAREGSINSYFGENDCGLFLFSTNILFNILKSSRSDGRGKGARTGEWNLLPLLPEFEVGEEAVVTLRSTLIEETQGINTPEEAILVEEFLKSRRMVSNE